MEKFAWKAVRDICVTEAVYGSFTYITNPTLSVVSELKFPIFN